MLSKFPLLAAASLAAFATLLPPAAQAEIVTSQSLYMADRANQTGFNVKESTVTANTGNFSWFGVIGKRSGVMQDFVVVFQLPSLGDGGSFTAANLQVSPYKKNNLSTLAFDLYGMDVTTSAVSVDTSFYFAGTGDSDNTLIQSSFLSTSTGAYYNASLNTNASGDAALQSWLNAMYDGGENAGKYVYLRLTPNVATATASDDYMQILTASSPTDSAPSLVITYDAEVIPEPGTLALVGIGAMMAFGRFRRDNRVA